MHICIYKERLFFKAWIKLLNETNKPFPLHKVTALRLDGITRCSPAGWARFIGSASQAIRLAEDCSGCWLPVSVCLFIVNISCLCIEYICIECSCTTSPRYVYVYVLWRLCCCLDHTEQMQLFMWNSTKYSTVYSQCVHTAKHAYSLKPIHVLRRQI
jgi:hypothetical protein